MKKQKTEESRPLQKWFDDLKIKQTNHMDKRGNLTRPPKK